MSCCDATCGRQAGLTNRTHDANYVRVQIGQAGVEAMIPSKNNRTAPLEHDAQTHKEGNQVERTINGLKYFRTVATRFDKWATNYFATCYLLAALTWL